MNSIVLEWPCKRCGAILSEIDFLITRKYCKVCAKIRSRTKSNRNRSKNPIGQKLAYVLKTNRKITMGELIAFTGNTKTTITTTLSSLRKEGYHIKFSGGFYYYGGIHKDSDGDLSNDDMSHQGNST